MKFPFNERKTAQAAAYLINLAGGSMNYMVLIKLLYLADRRALLETGVPITGDRMVSMPHGPVLSTVLDLINMGKHGEAHPSPWFEYLLEPENFQIAVAQDSPASDELSKYELDVLEAIFKSFGSLDKWKIVELLHTLPEWQDPDGSSVAIDPREILRAEGKSNDEIEEIARNAQEQLFLAKIKNAG
ncbi:MAG: Panacea domain-containing protein [Candidatus Eisenbacteria bacterium]|nr:Panacea domain-containing protein [Candidatus Eisenbacteria bacterium]